MILCVTLVGSAATPPAASADWLLTGFVGPITNVKTSESATTLVDAEQFDSSVGFGVNLASAFPSRANLGFELDWAYLKDALKTSDVYGTDYASKVMTVSTNFFYSPAIPRVRPYFSVGPSFSYRSDRDDSLFTTESGWAVGMNVGGGVMAFANERFAGRVDVRYFRNFGDFFDITPGSTLRSNGWKDLQFFRFFFGGTVVLN
jgi:opacity protein-like surface antigen